VSWIGKSKIQVFGCVDVTPGRMSYWMPGRKNSEGGELEGVVELDKLFSGLDRQSRLLLLELKP
jgi:hypothetical protein